MLNEHLAIFGHFGSRRGSWRALLATLAMGWFCANESCLLLTDRDKDQCRATADCLARGSRFAGTQCIDGICVETASGIGTCASNADCLADPNTPNTYCGAENQCLPIRDANCGAVVTSDGKPATPDSILLGVLAPLTGDNATDGDARVRAVQLAQSEFAERAIGIPSDAGQAPRPIALVVCDQVADAEAAATHLVAHVRVPAIIGPGFSGATVKVAKNVTIPGGALLMTPSATTPDLSTLQDNGLVWRTSSSFEPESRGFASLVAQMEQHLTVRGALGLDATASIKVAVLAKGDSYGKGLADFLTNSLRFNGVSAAANGAAYFARFDFPDLTANPNADTGAAVTGIVQAFKPHFVLALGTAEVITKGIAAVEEQWLTGSGAPARPFYILSEGAKLSQLVDIVAASTSSHPDRQLKDRIRVFGPRYNAELYAALQNRYSASNNHTPMPDAYGVTGSYDAFYLIAYALVASHKSQPTGASIAEGLKRTVAPGLSISAGPTDVSRAIAELMAGRSINYDGVTGALDFDVATGESPGDYDLFCVQPTGFVQSGQYFNSSTATLVNDYAPCP